MGDSLLVFLNGTVGVGKSTVAEALAERAEVEGLAHVVIDADYIRRAWPAPANDPFNHELELRNLAALATNYRDVGVCLFIVAGVMETYSEKARYAEAMGVENSFVVRLTAPEKVVAERLTRRHVTSREEVRAWHLQRAPELAVILHREQPEDAVVETATKDPTEIADEVWNLISTFLQGKLRAHS